jgi:hypothetical protein
MPTVTPTGIMRIVAFQNPDLFASFGLPPEYRATAAGRCQRTTRRCPGGPAEPRIAPVHPVVEASRRRATDSTPKSTFG